eukprot:1159668-Pelagomonas_calceolata.AAC.11
MAMAHPALTLTQLYKATWLSDIKQSSNAARDRELLLLEYMKGGLWPHHCAPLWLTPAHAACLLTGLLSGRWSRSA